MLGSDVSLAPRNFLCDVIMCSKTGLLLSCTLGTFIVRSCPCDCRWEYSIGATLRFAIELELGRLLTVA